MLPWKPKRHLQESSKRFNIHIFIERFVLFPQPRFGYFVRVFNISAFYTVLEKITKKHMCSAFTFSQGILLI